MSKKEETLSFVDFNLKLGRMKLSAYEKKTIISCLSGETRFDDAISKAFAKYRKTTA